MSDFLNFKPSKLLSFILPRTLNAEASIIHYSSFDPVVFFDVHYGSTGNRSRRNVFILRLNEYDPSARYWISSDIRGTRLQDQLPGRTGCSGIVYLRREKDLDWQVSVMNVQPYKSVNAADEIKAK